jgi:hypothetical protein
VCPLHATLPVPGQALLSSSSSSSASSSNSSSSIAAAAAATVTAVGDLNAMSDYAASVRVFCDQLIIPDFRPDGAQLNDNHFRLQLSIKEEIESTPQNFKLITKNNYEKFPVEKLPPLIVSDSGCECLSSCDDGSCFNHAMRVECCEMRTADKDLVCHVGADHCANRALQRKHYARTKVFREGDMGLGLKAVEGIAAGRLVIEYLGEIIDDDEMQRRLHNQRTLTPNDKDYYIMELSTGVYVDGKFEGNVSRYINHSCDPNCELQRWNVRGKMRIGIFAIKDIQPGESLSYDYQFDTQEEDVFKCYCGTAKCRGTMAPNKKGRLAAMVESNQLSKVMRQKLIQSGRNKEKKSEEARAEAEWALSYTGRCLPGDTAELKNGPARNTFHAAAANNIFLVRNVLRSTDFLYRKKLLDLKIQMKLAKQSLVNGRKGKEVRKSGVAI